MTATSGRRAIVSLPSDEQIHITREFDAPKRLVYRAWTTPELVRRWWTARRFEMTVCEIDLRVGGRWRYAGRDDDGVESAFHGEYREIVADERIVSTEVYEDIPDAEAVYTVTFTEPAAGRTVLAILVEHASRANRDEYLRYSDGLQEAMNLFEQVVLELRAE
jgi:uncharacterized protein YndB with AHSA1/START domain